MSKAKVIPNPAMEGTVSRAVDFNLKKEDLMLLILEGRKEAMEENIGQLQTVSTKLKSELVEAQIKYEAKFRKLCIKSLSADALKMAQNFSKKEISDEDNERFFHVSLSTQTDVTSYTHFHSSPIGDGKGATYIKQQSEKNITFNVFSKLTINIDLSLHGKSFAKKSDIFRNEEVGVCGEYSREYKIVEEYLNIEHQKTLPEYKAMKEIAEAFAKNEALLSDILAEYDLYNRNQPRAKAKMIKEVLSRDEAGQALLGNIMQAASGVKLLGGQA